MKSKLKKLSQKTFVRNVLVVATGTAAAQVITMLLSPIITRMYGPEAYGVLGVFVSVVGIIGPIAALTYPIAIVLPKTSTEAKGLVRLSLYTSLFISILVTITLLLFNKQIVSLFNIEDIAPFLYLIPLVILFSGLLQVTEQWLIRTKQFKVTARVTFMQSVILNGSKIGVGFFHPVGAVLVILTTMGYLLKAAMLSFMSNKSNSEQRELEKIEEEINLSKLAKDYKDFPKFRAPQVFINAISQNFPVLMLTSLFGPAAAGFYSIGKTVLSMPAQLIGKSVGDVFYPRISEAANKGESLYKLIKKATIALGIVGILPYVVVIAFGPLLFSLVFGSEWEMAGQYARWIALWTYFMFLNQPSVRALPVLSAQSFHLKFTIVTLIIRVTALVLGYLLFLDDLVAVAFFCVSGAILNVALVILTLKKAKGFR